MQAQTYNRKIDSHSKYSTKQYTFHKTNETKSMLPWATYEQCE